MAIGQNSCNEWECHERQKCLWNKYQVFSYNPQENLAKQHFTHAPKAAWPPFEFLRITATLGCDKIQGNNIYFSAWQISSVIQFATGTEHSGFIYSCLEPILFERWCTEAMAERHQNSWGWNFRAPYPRAVPEEMFLNKWIFQQNESFLLSVIKIRSF